MKCSSRRRGIFGRLGRSLGYESKKRKNKMMRVERDLG